MLLDDDPAGFRSWLIAETPDPAQAWLEHELTGHCSQPGLLRPAAGSA